MNDGEEAQSRASFAEALTSPCAMAAAASKTARSGIRAASGAAATIAVMAGMWILLVAGTKLHEMIVGALSAAAAALFLYSVKVSSTLKLQFRLADVATCWRVPGYLALDVWVITRVLVLDLLRIKRATPCYCVWSFRTSKEDPVEAARRVLATVYTSTTPNSIVLGVDYKQQRILIHQMERSGLTAMARQLGAKPFRERKVVRT